MAELFASDNALLTEGTASVVSLGRAAVTPQPQLPCTAHHPAFVCFVDDDESSSESKAMKSFLRCSQDWEQLRSLADAPVGITVQAWECALSP